MSITARARGIASNAVGESVTADRLLGNVEYYPKILANLQEYEQPHYISLLTKDGPVRIGLEKPRDRYTYHHPGNSVLVATNEFVHIIGETYSNQQFGLSTSYKRIERIDIRDGLPNRKVQISFSPGDEYWRVIEARSAPPEMLDELIDFVAGRSTR